MIVGAMIASVLRTLGVRSIEFAKISIREFWACITSSKVCSGYDVGGRLGLKESM